jgi:branched-chain amino acid transport system substrate-binding protein
VSLLAILWVCCIFQTPVAAENTTITCGVILPLSGDLEATGTDILQGIELAANETNEKWAASGRKIDLRITDDQGDPRIALSRFTEMQNDGVPVVIGSYTTSLTLAMAKETKNNPGTVLISPQANGDDLYGISPRFFQVNPPIFSLAQFIEEWLAYTSDRAAIIYSDDEYGRSVLSHIQTGLVNQTIPVTDTEPVTGENTDYATLSQEILNGAPDAIVIIVYDSSQIPIIRNLSDAGFRGQVILTESGLIDTLEKEESDRFSQFSLFTISSYANLVPGNHTEHFISAYQEKYGRDPTKNLAGYGYDSLMVVAQAIPPGCENGNVTAELIRKGLDDSRYYGVSGPKVFDSHHAVCSAQDRWVFRDGKFVLMTTSLV